MTRPYRYIEVERRGDVFCVRLCQTQLDEFMIYDLAGELRRLVSDEGCRKLALSLGPQAPECLYSIFLAKLITLQRVLREHEGELVLCNLPPAVRSIFAACGLDQIFHFLPNFDAAVAFWEKQNHESHE
ncbi:MAG TPA: STAS domain-containing protein [Gemmataceae bacterium]|nr:STAS domain-containing protein [Gemmataceae bacterium]